MQFLDSLLPTSPKTNYYANMSVTIGVLGALTHVYFVDCCLFRGMAGENYPLFTPKDSREQMKGMIVDFKEAGKTSMWKASAGYSMHMVLLGLSLAWLTWHIFSKYPKGDDLRKTVSKLSIVVSCAVNLIAYNFYIDGAANGSVWMTVFNILTLYDEYRK